MTLFYDRRAQDFGTRVRLFPQAPFLAGFAEPEVVWLSPPAGSVGPGPSDDRMYVIDAIDKSEPYQFPYLPPYYGPARPPVLPDSEGHFAHIPVDSRDFLAVHMYGSVRRVLDIFESYLGDRIEWQFGQHFRRLEIIPLIDWDNAQSGFGYIEFGRSRAEDGTALPYGLNFDVIAHEIGHSILFSLMGLPETGQMTAEFRAFHESAADVTALIAVMHFDTVLDRLLRSCRGNIYVLNELNRLGEVADAKQIRLASNGDRMSDVGLEPHDMSRPLTGACFDIIAYLYSCELAERDLVPRSLWAQAYETNSAGRQSEHVAVEFARCYANRHFAFKAALASARDIFGRYLVSAWQSLSPDRLTFEDFVAALLRAERRVSGSRYQEEICEIFRWRRIGVPDI